MIQQEPFWSFTPHKTLTLWYGHVHFLESYVLGQWFCLSRNDGSCLWEKSFRRANAVCGISKGVIVATETVNYYFATFNAGCYGIELTSGKLLWAYHANGLLGKLLKLCDLIPGYLNSMRDSPLVVDNRCVTTSKGQILDPLEGKRIHRISRKKAMGLFEQTLLSKEKELYHQGFTQWHGSWLTHKLPNADQNITKLEWAHDFHQNGFHLYRINTEGKTFWEFHLDDYIEGSYYSYRHDNRYVYMIVSQEKNYCVNPKTGHTEYRPVKYFFLTVDIEQGKVVQKFPLNDDDLVSCRIEDIDAQGILISFRKNFTQRKHNEGNEKLCYYRKQNINT